MAIAARLSGAVSTARRPARAQLRVTASGARPAAAPALPARPWAPLPVRPAAAEASTTAAHAFNFSNQKEYNEKLAQGRDVTVPFDQSRWATHQNAWRHLRHQMDFFQSRVLQRITGPIAWIALVACAAVLLKAHCANAFVQSLCATPMTPFNVTASTLGLLLVFRTNASYGRWDEARKMWGLMVNRTRDMNRQYAAYFPSPCKLDKRAFMQRWTAAFVYSLKCHLREKGDLENELKDILPPHELAELMAAGHKPLYTLQALAAGISGSGASPYLKGIMDQNLTAMEDVVGGCERLLRTPIPLSYTRHTTRFLITWLTLLPFSLVTACGWATIPIAASIAFVMLGVEEIGVNIEEPFKILALDALCATIAGNTKNILDTSTAVDGLHTTEHLFNKAVPLAAQQEMVPVGIRT